MPSGPLCVWNVDPMWCPFFVLLNSCNFTNQHSSTNTNVQGLWACVAKRDSKEAEGAEGWVFFGTLFSPFWCPFFSVGGWCRLKLCHFCKLWHENLKLLTRSGFCNPALLLRLRVLQPNTPFRASGVAAQHSVWGFRALQPNTP